MNSAHSRSAQYNLRGSGRTHSARRASKARCTSPKPGKAQQMMTSRRGSRPALSLHSGGKIATFSRDSRMMYRAQAKQSRSSPLDLRKEPVHQQTEHHGLPSVSTRRCSYLGNRVLERSRICLCLMGGRGLLWTSLLRVLTMESPMRAMVAASRCPVRLRLLSLVICSRLVLLSHQRRSESRRRSLRSFASTPSGRWDRFFGSLSMLSSRLSRSYGGARDGSLGGRCSSAIVASD